MQSKVYGTSIYSYYSRQTILYFDHPAMYHVKQQRYKVMWVPIINMENQRGGVDTEESGVGTFTGMGRG